MFHGAKRQFRRPHVMYGVLLLSLSFASGCHKETPSPDNKVGKKELPQKKPNGGGHSKSTNKNLADRLLKKVIRRDKPELNRGDLTDWQRVNILREWVHKNADYALSNDFVNDDIYEAYKNKAVADLFGDFFSDDLAVWCYGTANSYVRICQLFGYEAYVLNIGWNEDPQVSTHAVALVSVEIDGKKRWVMQDADYNYTFVDKNNSPLDYFQALSLLKNKRHEEIHLLKGKRQSRELVATSKQTKGSSWIFSHDKGEPKLARRTKKGHYVYHGQGTIDEFSSCFLSHIHEAHLKPASYPKDIRYLFLFPFAVKNSKVGRNKALFAQIKAQIESTS